MEIVLGLCGLRAPHWGLALLDVRVRQPGNSEWLPAAGSAGRVGSEGERADVSRSRG